MENLSQSALTGVLWASLEKFGGKAIQFVTSIILARILLPEDFGLIAMVVIVFAVANVLVDSGFSQALIREKTITEGDRSTVFFSNFAIAVTIAVSIWFLSPLISDYFAEPVLTDITRLMALTPIFVSFTIVQRAHYSQKINFRTQAYINLIASTGSSILAIYAAIQGLGVWSLAIQYVSVALFTSLLFWGANPWIPKKFINKDSFKKLFSFGSKLMLSGLIHVIFTQVYRVIIGKMYNASLLGFYAYADNMKNSVAESLASVMARVNYSALSKVKNDKKRLEEAYRKIIRVSTFIVFPAMIGLILVAEPMVIALIGEKWLGSVPILQVLCLAGLIHHLQVINLEILKVVGRSDLFLRLEIIKKTGATIAIIAGLNFGFWGLVIAQVISSYIALFINMTYTARFLNYNRISQMKDVLPVLLLCTPMAGIVFILGEIEYLNEFLESGLLVVSGIIIYGASSYIIKPESFKDFIHLLKPKFKFLKHLNI